MVATIEISQFVEHMVDLRAWSDGVIKEAGLSGLANHRRLVMVAFWPRLLYLPSRLRSTPHSGEPVRLYVLRP